MLTSRRSLAGAGDEGARVREPLKSLRDGVALESPSEASIAAIKLGATSGRFSDSMGFHRDTFSPNLSLAGTLVVAAGGNSVGHTSPGGFRHRSAPSSTG
jgi:hypothetical protein